MTNQKEKKLFLNIFIVGLILLIIQTVLQRNDEFLNILNAFNVYLKPFIYGIFIAMLFNPAVEIIEKKLKFSRMVSLWAAFFIFLLIFTGIMLWFIPSLIHSFEDMVQMFPTFQEKFMYYLREIFEFLREKDLLVMDGTDIQKAIEDFIVSNIQNIKNILFSISINVVYWVVEIFIFFLGLFLAIYFILYKNYFMRFFKNMVFLFYDKEKSESALKFLIEAKDIFLNYMLGRILISTIVGIVAYIVMIFGKVPYALIIAVMIGVGNMIPYFGSIVAGIIAFLLVVLIEPFKVLYIFLAMGIAQTVDGYVVGPLILSKSVGLGSFWVIASVIIMGNIMGTTGMFLGVPIFAVLKLIYTRLLERKEKDIELKAIEEKENNNFEEF
ncbi:AI-2E family transporter [Fusobacterium perfoetens]|uniref:AI-2E family transporter n=1 Tax=Fusobacterium perfoetens TaxID=852 RepID=UPI000686ABF6|nr:AI-2E family transporter [Fusobacterium perfoetens]